jgi:hypothetical protein
MFWLVPDCVGACDASKREGPRCGATEEVVGMVRGPSEGLVMLWIACAHYSDMTIEVALLALLSGVGVIGLLETVESGPRCRPLFC